MDRDVMTLDVQEELLVLAPLQKLAAATRLLNSTLSLEEKVQRVTEMVGAMVGAQQAVTHLTFSSSPIPPLTTAWFSEPREAAEAHLRRLADAPLCALVCQKNEVLRLTQAELEVHPAWQPLERLPGLPGWLAVPLTRQDGQNSGFLQVSGKEGGAFTPQDEAILYQLAQMLSLAAENTRLVRSEQNARQVAETLRVASLALTQNLDLGDVLETLLDYLGWIVPYDAASVLLREGSSMVVVRALRSYEENATALSQGHSFQVDATPILEELFANQRSVLIPNTQVHPVWSHSVEGGKGHSWLGVPLLSEGETIGLCAVEKGETNFFTEEHLRLVEALAAQTEVAIRNARLFEALRLRATELEALVEVSTALRAARAVEEMLPIFLQKAAAIVGATLGTIYLQEPETNQLVARGWYPPHPELLGLHQHPNAHVAEQVFQTGEIAICRDGLDVWADLLPARQSGLEMLHSTISLPLRTLESIVGLMHLALPQEREFTEVEVRLLTGLAEMAGNSLHRAVLYEQTEQRLHRLAALRTIDRAITTSLDLLTPLEVLLDQLRIQLRVDAADILLFDPNSNQMECVAWHGFRTERLAEPRFPLGDDVGSRAIIERRLIAIPQIQLGQAPPSRAALWLTEDFTTYFSVPLIAMGQIRGVLEVFHRTPLHPDAEWIDFLEALAGQAAIAIDNALLFENLQRSNLELSQAYDATIAGWARALDLRDEGTRGHSDRVTEMTMQLARALGLKEADLLHVRRGALLHDIGKMGIPDGILLKPGPLTQEEREIMELHPGYAYEMLLPIAFLRLALDIPYCHHEKWDGTGYPRGLKGEEIPLAARMFAVVDVWDALRSDRPYRKAWLEERVRDHIRSLAGTHFDGRVVDVFLKIQVDE
ncbi:MAG: GAF domain-containing protein [Ardenticatenales bacterium]|nr:GAF domain-containing protein [Ardenticatenales bacterium]